MPACAATPCASITIKPPLPFNFFFCCGVKSRNNNPIRLISGLLRPLLGLATSSLSLGASPTVIASVLVAPLRRTSAETVLPGLTAATTRGKSDEAAIALPSNFRITSPASKPLLSAGPPFSTPAIKAPFVFFMPNESANSLLIS